MISLSVLYRNGLWISAVVFFISAVSLGFFILKVVRLARQAQITSVRLLDQQDIEFANSGRVVLNIEGPRATRRFAKLDYELIARDGTRVKGQPILLPNRTSGVSRIRMGVESYEIPRPGRYALRIKGLEAGWTADVEHRIVFTKPYLARSIAYVVGIVLAGVLLIGSVVLFFLRLSGAGVGP